MTGVGVTVHDLVVFAGQAGFAEDGGPTILSTSVAVRDVEVAARVLAEGLGAAEGPGSALGPVATGERNAELDRAQLAGAEIGVEVAARERGDLGAAVDVAAHDRAAVGDVAAGVVVRVGEDRRGRPGAAPGEALAGRPAEVGAAPDGGRRRQVDLLPGALADVADGQVPGGGVEGEAPRVAEPRGPDLVARGAGCGVGVAPPGSSRRPGSPRAGRSAGSCRSGEPRLGAVEPPVPPSPTEM